MSNHVHLVVVPPNTQALAHSLRQVHGRYARYLNAREANSGHLWQGRYYSCLVEEAGPEKVMRYVEMNPVRAGLVQWAGDYVWSSAVAYLGAILFT